MDEHPIEASLAREMAAWDSEMADQLEANFEPPFDADMVRLAHMLAARRVPYVRAADQAAAEGFTVTAWMIRRLLDATPRRRPSTVKSSTSGWFSSPIRCRRPETRAKFVTRQTISRRASP